MKFIASDKQEDKLASPNQPGEFENYLPTKNVFIQVDTDKVKSMNMVDPRDMGKVLPRMQWTINGTLLKNDLLTLDMVANNIMDRPIYYAVSVAPDAYEGMDKFFQLEGMAYRVVPIENPGRNAQTCPVRTDVCYTNMMDKFGFGGIKENPNIYLDENILRMTMNLRGNYARLASALVDRGEKDKAIKALDKAIIEMPKDRVPYNIFVAMYPSIYYSAGDSAKARSLSKDLWASAKDEIKYYQYVFSVMLQKAKESDRAEYDQLRQGKFIQTRAIQEELYMMQELVQAAKTYESPEVSGAMEKEFRDLQFSFVPMQQEQMQQQMQQQQKGQQGPSKLPQ
jgi:tetratricopeptide (TPR) repeat protein